MDDFPFDNGPFGSPSKFYVGAGVSFGSGGYKVNFGIMGSKNVGDWTGSIGAGVTYHSNFYETGKKGWELRKSAMVSYDDGDQGGALGSNWWSGLGNDSELNEFNQRTGMMKYRNGDFNIMYENDGAPFGKMKLGDGNDSYRTAALQVGIGEKFHVGFNLLTGRRGRYKDNEGKIVDDYLTSKERKSDKELIDKGEYGEFKEYYPNGIVAENSIREKQTGINLAKQYRFGGAYIGYGRYRAGINSDRYVRHPIQDRFAHDIGFTLFGKRFGTEQPGFRTLSDDVLPYWQSRSRNPFSTW